MWLKAARWVHSLVILAMMEEALDDCHRAEQVRLYLVTERGVSEHTLKALLQPSTTTFNESWHLLRFVCSARLVQVSRTELKTLRYRQQVQVSVVQSPIARNTLADDVMPLRPTSVPVKSRLFGRPDCYKACRGLFPKMARQQFMKGR